MNFAKKLAESKTDNECLLVAGPGPLGKTCGDCINLRGCVFKKFSLYVCDISSEENIVPSRRACQYFQEKPQR